MQRPLVPGLISRMRLPSAMARLLHWQFFHDLDMHRADGQTPLCKGSCRNTNLKNRPHAPNLAVAFACVLRATRKIVATRMELFFGGEGGERDDSGKKMSRKELVKTQWGRHASRRICSRYASQREAGQKEKRRPKKWCLSQLFV